MKILRINDVCQMLGISKSMVYYKLNPKDNNYDPDFPRQIQISTRAVGWLQSDIDNYIAKRIAK